MASGIRRPGTVSHVTVFISHVATDAVIASAIKDFLEGIFLNATFFVSSRDLAGGDVWMEQLRRALASATAVIAIVTPASTRSTWVHFEAGAGFTNGRAIPVVSHRLAFEDMGAPLNLLQARTLDKAGLKSLVKDIAKLAGLRDPVRFPRIDAALKLVQGAVRSFEAEERAEQEAAFRDVPGDTFGRGTLLDENPDKALHALWKTVYERARTLIVRDLQGYRAAFEVPPQSELKKYSLLDLIQLAGAVGAELPMQVQMVMLRLDSPSPVPRATAPEWKKANARKNFGQLELHLNAYEMLLAERDSAAG